MELKNLVGTHKLTAVEFDTVYNEDDVVAALLFTLDGVTYRATEDPNDGYRSMFDELKIVNTYLPNTFTPVEVEVRLRHSESEYILEFVDVLSNLVVMELGTNNTDDYYPYCVLYWDPKNLFTNIGK